MADDAVMEVSGNIQIISADKLNDGLVIRFADGRCAFYSASLLERLYKEAEQLNEEDIVW